MEPFEIFVEISGTDQTYLVFEVYENESFEVFDADLHLGNFISVSDEIYGIRWETTALMPLELIEKIGAAIEKHFL